MNVGTKWSNKYRIFLLLGIFLVFGGLPALYGDDPEPEPEPKEEPVYPTDYPKVPEANYPTVLSDPTGYSRLGKISADGISFNYLNNYMMMQQIGEHLRNVPLATYHGEDGGANYPYSTGGMDSAPFGPGYAPADSQTIYNGGYYGAIMPSVFRGQAQYGDPGTLIYSFWGAMVGGTGTVKQRESDFGYSTEQAGGVIGLDLFCSSDCRSGLFYAYQQGKIKNLNYPYSWNDSISTDSPRSSFNTLPYGDPAQILATQTVYSYDANYNGIYTATLKSNNNLIGIYHQFGDEFVYNVATLRGGYNQVETTESISESGKTTGTRSVMYTNHYESETPIWAPDMDQQNIKTVLDASYKDSLTNKYNEYLGGISFERGANFRFAPFTITPRGALDYTYLYRDKSTSTGNATWDQSKTEGGITGGSISTVPTNYEVKKGSYNSIRSNIGANLALDLYPGEQHIKVALRGGWVHEFLNDIFGSTDIAYTGNTGTYYNTLNGNSFGRDWGEFGAGVEWTIVPSFMIFANYDSLLNDYLSQNYGDVGLAIMW